MLAILITTVAVAKTRRDREEEFVRKTLNIEEGQTLDATINVCDLDGDPVAMIIDDLPEGAVLLDTYPLTTLPDPNNCNEPNCLECYEEPETSWYGANLLWMPDYEQAGEYRLHVYAEDNQGGDDWVVIIINVINKNREPVL